MSRLKERTQRTGCALTLVFKHIFNCPSCKISLEFISRFRSCVNFTTHTFCLREYGCSLHVARDQRSV